MREEWWKRSEYQGVLPPLICGYCNEGHLIYRKELHLQKMSTDSERKYKMSHIDMMELWGHFTALGECTNCDDFTIVSGEHYFTEIELYDEYDVHYGRKKMTTYYINYVNPSPELIKLPENLSKETIKTIKKSFDLFWVDSDSCANKIRHGLELFLTSRNIDQTTIDKYGEAVNLMLHSRIDKFANEHFDLKDYLIALKHIGNQGSHSKDPMTREKLLIAYEMLDHVFKKLYDDSEQILLKKVKEVNKNKKI